MSEWKGHWLVLALAVGTPSFVASATLLASPPIPEAKGKSNSGLEEKGAAGRKNRSPSGPPLIPIMTIDTMIDFDGRPSIRTLALSPDGKRVAYLLKPYGLPSFPPAFDYERMIFLRDLNTKEGIRRIDTKENPQSLECDKILSLTFSPDSKKLAGLSARHGLLLWDFATGKKLVRFENSANTVFLAFCPDGKTLVGRVGTAIPNWSICCWDVATGKVRRYFRHKEEVLSGLAISADGRWIITEESSQIESVWRPGDGYTTYRRTAHLYDLTSGEYHGRIGRIALIDSRRPGAPVQKQREAGGGTPGFRVRISPHGTILAFPPLHYPSVSTSLKEFQTILSPESGFITPEGKIVARARSVSGGTVSPLTLRACEELLCRGNSKEMFPSSYHTFKGSLDWMGVSPSGDTLLVFGSYLRLPVPNAFVMDISQWRRHNAPPADLTPSQLEKYWQALASTDASKACEAAKTLAASPKQTIAFLQKHVSSAPKRDLSLIQQWIADLDSEKFAVREKAEHALRGIPEEALPVLRQTLAKRPSLEARRRIERILETVDLPTEETRQSLWAVELLEHLGSAEARQLLTKLAGGDANAWLTREVKASLDRLAKRSASP